MDAKVNLFIKWARNVIILVIFQIKAELKLNFESLRLNKFNSESYGSTRTKVWRRFEKADRVEWEQHLLGQQ